MKPDVIRKFKQIDGWAAKKKSALTMTNQDLAAYDRVEKEADRKKEMVLEDFASQQQDTVYQFLYNEDLWESCAGTVSVHSTLKGAQMALDFHKASTISKNNWGRLPKEELDERAYWGIRESKLIKS